MVLVVPAFDRLDAWADAEGLGGGEAGRRALLADPRCQTHLQEQLYGEMRDLAGFETPKKVGLLGEPFTVENGMLTPTQKVRRSRVTARYAELIESFYRAESVERTMFAAEG